jgi:hypothetical protein
MKNTVNSKLGTPTPLTDKNNYGKIYNMKHETLFNKLQSGICEIIYKDVHSIENTLIATLAPNHLPDDCDTMDILPPNDADTFVVCFNVNTEKWENVLVDSVVDIEQLTGEGAPNNEKKLRAGPEYIEQLDLFTTNKNTPSPPTPPRPPHNNDDCVIDDGDYDPSESDWLPEEDDDDDNSALLWDEDDSE